ncbi:gliding motility-associated C-terminal domain-containing protein [Flavobacterium sp. JP2137]|uniref:gliding motility-associated C-terminal domain-containing protein n=1 Tax=Flavobacterium sp. JP2137 TaxID=3414510 RepID=UPI003D2FE583
MNRKIKYAIYPALFFVGLCGHSQETGVMVNFGDIYISSNTEMTTLKGFDNTESGVVYNDGELYLRAYLKNNGLFTYNSTAKTGYTIFEGTEANRQLITGNKPIEFLDVLFNKTSIPRDFELKNDISISGTANFTQGILHLDSLQGGLVFEKNARAINMHQDSHVKGQVEKKGKEAFIYPVGNGQYYRRAALSAPPAVADHFSAEYFFKTALKQYPSASKAGVILEVNPSEYWVIKQLNSPSELILSLSWDANTTPAQFLATPEKNLHIVRWDDKEALWVDQGGIVDLAEKTVTTPTAVDGYGIFTLATVKHELILEGDVVIYNAVSTNGDGKNDYFFIDRIQEYPQNTVQIFNRWGTKVFETTNYDSSGNVFKGYSDGKGTLNKNEKLPTGTYYYILTYELHSASGTQVIKKAGYLHLENN